MLRNAGGLSSAPAAVRSAAGESATLRLAEPGERAGCGRTCFSARDDVGDDGSTFIELTLEQLAILAVADADAKAQWPELLVLIQPHPPGALDRRQGSEERVERGRRWFLRRRRRRCTGRRSGLGSAATALSTAARRRVGSTVSSAVSGRCRVEATCPHPLEQRVALFR